VTELQKRGCEDREGITGEKKKPPRRCELKSQESDRVPERFAGKRGIIITKGKERLNRKKESRERGHRRKKKPRVEGRPGKKELYIVRSIKISRGNNLPKK